MFRENIKKFGAAVSEQDPRGGPQGVTFIRDPLWNNIRVDPTAERLLDTAAVQRLRYVRQLGLAHLVYPGATHSRFEHALGAYHLARRTLARLQRIGRARGSRRPTKRAVVAAAALLHDVGHYPFSHALEEIGVPHHEEVSRPLVTVGEVADVLRSGDRAPTRRSASTRSSAGPARARLQGLISGSLDLDKMDYLKRDALMCGVPYGEIDEDRLMHALVVLDDPTTGRLGVGVRSRRGCPPSSRCCSRSTRCTATCTGTTRCAARRRCTSGWSRARSTEGAVDRRGARAVHGRGAALGARSRPTPRPARCSTTCSRAGCSSARSRRPPRRCRWNRSSGSPTTARARGAPKRRSRNGSGWRPATCCSIFRRRRRCSGSTCRCSAKDGSVRRLTQEGIPGAIDLPVLAEQLYRSARYLRVFTRERKTISRRELEDVLQDNCQRVETFLLVG